MAAYSWEDVSSRAEKVCRFRAEEVPVVDSIYERLGKITNCQRFVESFSTAAASLPATSRTMVSKLRPASRLAGRGTRGVASRTAVFRCLPRFSSLQTPVDPFKIP